MSGRSRPRDHNTMSDIAAEISGLTTRPEICNEKHLACLPTRKHTQELCYAIVFTTGNRVERCLSHTIHS